MKKITLLSIAVLAISFTSCKKDYTCQCTYTNTGSTTPTVTSVTLHTTKSKAKDACNQSATSGGSGYTCVIK